MSDIGWRADGIERALAAGGVPLETYIRPGFVAGKGVRRSDLVGGGCGIQLDTGNDWVHEPDPDLSAFEKRGPA